MKRILFKTTIPTTDDDWHIGRFSLLQREIESIRNDCGEPVFSVTARDRTTDADGDDLDLVNLPDSDYEELWLFAVDVGAGLSTADASAIRRFMARGGGLLFTRDHHDLGACLQRPDRCAVIRRKPLPVHLVWEPDIVGSLEHIRDRHAAPRIRLRVGCLPVDSGPGGAAMPPAYSTWLLHALDSATA